MADHGLSQGAYVYFADSAFVTKDNLNKTDDNQTWFLTRLPATYNEYGRVIQDAVANDQWIDIGILTEGAHSAKRPAPHYRVNDSTAELYAKAYRAIVVHSSAF